MNYGQNTALWSVPEKNLKRSGLVLIIAGLAVLWIPYLRYIGYFLCIGGLLNMKGYDRYFDRKYWTASRRSLWLSLHSALIIIFAVGIFYMIIEPQVQPAPGTNAVSAREYVFNLTFLVYFFIEKFFGLVFILGVAAAIFRFSDSRGKIVLITGLLVTTAMIVTESLMLNVNYVLPYNSWNGSLSTEQFINTVLNYPFRYLVYYVVPYSILALSAAMAWRGLNLQKIGQKH